MIHGSHPLTKKNFSCALEKWHATCNKKLAMMDDDDDDDDDGDDDDDDDDG